MYHYVVIKTVVFFSIMFISLVLLNNVQASYSAKQRWNYKKKEDTINHHTLNLRIKTKSQRITSDKNMRRIRNDDSGLKRKKPGSPRERW